MSVIASVAAASGNRLRRMPRLLRPNRPIPNRLAVVLPRLQAETNLETPVTWGRKQRAIEVADDHRPARPRIRGRRGSGAGSAYRSAERPGQDLCRPGPRRARRLRADHVRHVRHPVRQAARRAHGRARQSRPDLVARGRAQGRVRRRRRSSGCSATSSGCTGCRPRRRSATPTTGKWSGGDLDGFPTGWGSTGLGIAGDCLYWGRSNSTNTTGPGVTHEVKIFRIQPNPEKNPPVEVGCDAAAHRRRRQNRGARPRAASVQLHVDGRRRAHADGPQRRDRHGRRRDHVHRRSADVSPDGRRRDGAGRARARVLPLARPGQLATGCSCSRRPTDRRTKTSSSPRSPTRRPARC